MQYVEFPTPVEPVSQPVGAFPALAPPAQPPHPPRRRGPARIVVSVPVSVLLGLVVLAALAGLLVLPVIMPWPAPPPLPPPGSPESGVGVLGTPDPPGGSGIDAGPSAGTGPGSGASPEGGASRGPGATASVTPVVDPSGPPSATGAAPPPTGDVSISYFAATRLALVAGYQVTVSITNSASEARSWENVGIQVNGGVPLTVTPAEPVAGVRAFRGSGRACLAPITSDAATLDGGDTLTIVFQINALLSQVPGPARTPDRDGCATAES